MVDERVSKSRIMKECFFWDVRRGRHPNVNWPRPREGSLLARRLALRIWPVSVDLLLVGEPSKPRSCNSFSPMTLVSVACQWWFVSPFSYNLCPFVRSGIGKSDGPESSAWAWDPTFAKSEQFVSCCLQTSTAGGFVGLLAEVLPSPTPSFAHVLSLGVQACKIHLATS